MMGKPVFNRTNDNVDWARWTWNPVTGCLYECDYCYARDIANRFYTEIGKTMDYYILNHLGPAKAHEPFAPRFWPDRLEAPFNTKVPRAGDNNVFVCSMADLFGEWVPHEWIDAVMDVVRREMTWNYIFLTKNPKRLLTIDWPVNTWVGATADTQERARRALKVFQEMAIRRFEGEKNLPGKKFLSCEPLLERIDFEAASPYDIYKMIDWIIIGGQSRTSAVPAFQPEWAWVEKILFDAHEDGIPVYFKPNLTVRPREYPRS